jgi:hypothetical protein
MSATFVSDEKLAVATKITVIKADIVFVVIAMKGQFELVEPKAGAILSIPFCFFQLADHTVIHFLSSFQDYLIRCILEISKRD